MNEGRCNAVDSSANSDGFHASLSRTRATPLSVPITPREVVITTIRKDEANPAYAMNVWSAHPRMGPSGQGSTSMYSNQIVQLRAGRVCRMTDTSHFRCIYKKPDLNSNFFPAC